MALGDNYITIQELKSYAQIADTVDDTGLSEVASAVSRLVERYTGR